MIDRAKRKKLRGIRRLCELERRGKKLLAQANALVGRRVRLNERRHGVFYGTVVGVLPDYLGPDAPAFEIALSHYGRVVLHFREELSLSRQDKRRRKTR